MLFAPTCRVLCEENGCLEEPVTRFPSSCSQQQGINPACWPHRRREDKERAGDSVPELSLSGLLFCPGCSSSLCLCVFCGEPFLLLPGDLDGPAPVLFAGGE